MSWSNSATRYSNLSIALHWLMLVLLVVVYACMELKGFFPKGSDPRILMKNTHFMLGLSVFALVWLRLAARFAGGAAPAITPPAPAWQLLLSKGVHLALYALMIGMPLGGWIILSAEGQPIPFFGLELPALVEKNRGLAEQFEELHEIGASVGYVLIGVHAVAALFHHYFMRDNTLRRMLPGRG